ncbi:hypothetical protein GCM10029963_40370 [Micromonospora andamanensis]|uniref:hypothetical protein n=1 Tax=Micromonospora andamanensis TaxID=1287068 RepID=UPI0019501F54|nr:hypothetical protein [Micromonospora andamanensis]GIJ42234.1 hypothetical protein Vwe01_55590 [Micromonospora andamanensis]
MNAKIAYMKPAKSPWWQTAKTPKQGFLMGGFWLVIAAWRVVVAIGDSTLWHWVFAAVWAVGSVAYLVPALLLRRRQSATQVEAGPEAAVRAD